MQTQSVQSITDRRQIAGMVDGVVLAATVHPVDENFAKQFLWQLHLADRQRSWDIEIQSDSISFWCDLHPTYGYRMTSLEVGKGLSNVTRRAQELVERIKAGCYQGLKP